MKKKCRICKKEKDIQDFYPNARMKDGYFNFCKLCMNLRAKAWRGENQEATKKHHQQEKIYRNIGYMLLRGKMKINQMLDEFLVEAETDVYRSSGDHMIPTEMGKRLLRDFAVWCDERLTKRGADLSKRERNLPAVSNQSKSEKPA